MERLRPHYSAEKGTGSGDEESLEAADSSFETYLREHGFPKLKNLDLTMCFGGHSTQQDAEALAAHFKSVDLFIPEVVGHHPEDEEMLNRIANNMASELEIGRMQEVINDNGYWRTLVAAIKGSFLKVAIADLPETEAEAFKRSTKNIVHFLANEIVDRQWSRVAARQIYARRIEKARDQNDVRERRLVSEICPTIVRAFQGGKLPSEKESLKVLMFVGHRHLPIFRTILEQHPSTKKIEVSTHSVQYKDELDVLYRSGAVPSDQLCDNVLMETLVGALLSQVNELTEDSFEGLQEMIRQMVDEMNEEERKTFYNFFLSENLPGAHNFLSSIVDRIGKRVAQAQE